MLSQNNEEQVIADHFAAFPPRYGKRLLDIGAWDGVHLSNTRPLVEAGWKSILVEAAAGPFTRLIENTRPYLKTTRLVQAFVTSHQTEMHPSRLVQLQHTWDAVSTADPQVYDTWKCSIADYYPIFVPCVTLQELLAGFPGPFDLLSLDTEGETYSIFLSFLALSSADLIVVEHASGGVTYAAQMADAANANGYVEVARNPENLIFKKVIPPGAP